MNKAYVWTALARQKVGAAQRRGGASAEAIAPREQPRRVRIFTIVSMALLMQSIDSTIVATALHALQHDLRTSVNLAAWTITVYPVGVVVTLPLSARISDRYGRKRIFLLSVLVFGATSLLCGVAQNILVLIILRACQAVGGAGLTPSATSLVVEHFGNTRERAIGLFGSVYQIGATIGPILGGLLVAAMSWRWIFFINVPISVVIIVAGLKLIPHETERPTTVRPRFDLPSLVLLGGAILSGMLGATWFGESNYGWVVAVATLVASGILTCLFLLRARSAIEPLIPPRLIYGRDFAAINIVNFVYTGATVGVVSLVPLYAISRYRMSALDSGTLLSGQAVAGALASIIAALVLRRTGYRLPLYLGAVLAASGMFGLAIGPRGMSAYTWLAFAALLIGAGTGCASPAGRIAGLRSAPDHAATVAALRTISVEVGYIVSVAVITAFIASSSASALAQAYSFAAFGCLLLVVLPVISRLPSRRGQW